MLFFLTNFLTLWNERLKFSSSFHRIHTYFKLLTIIFHAVVLMMLFFIVFYPVSILLLGLVTDLASQTTLLAWPFSKIIE